MNIPSKQGLDRRGASPPLRVERGGARDNPQALLLTRLMQKAGILARPVLHVEKGGAA